MVSLVFSVCLVLFLIKALIAFRDLDNPDLPPCVADGPALATLGRVVLCCGEDFAVGAGCLLAVGLALALWRARWYQYGVRLLAHVAAAAALAYMAASAQLFHVERRFLTVALFQIAGGFRPEPSVAEHLNRSLLLAVVLVPALTLAVHLAGSATFGRAWRRAASLACRPVVILVLLAGFTATAYAARHAEFSQHNRDFVQNPHLMLARSYFWNLEFGDLEDWDDDLSDFRPGNPHFGASLPEGRPTNIVLIVLESGGAKYSGDYGYPIATMPNLDRLGRQGIVFDNFYATANHTIASALPLFGSTYNKLNTISTVVDHPEFPVPAAPDWLQRHGYETCFLGSGGHHALENYRNMGPAFLDKGFDIGRDPEQPFWQACPNPCVFQGRDYLDDSMFADGKRYLRAAKGKKFFLMLWNYDTHTPYYDGDDSLTVDERCFPAAVASDAEKREELCTYLRSLHRVDALIGDFYRELESLGLAEDTVFVVTGDHGECFGQHGWFYHGASLYDEEVRVPLYLICPRLAGHSPRNATIGSHIDLWPTLLDVCGLPMNPQWQGKSLLGDFPSDERRAYFFRRGDVGVRQGKYKYIWNYENQRDFLFDLEADPDEKNNLAAEHKAYCKRQRARLRDWTYYQEEMTKERLRIR
jgi:arylsulfatase A-like enzyme